MRRIVFITGLSGSGKTTAKDAFEDMGFYCIDNLPVGLLDEFVSLSGRSAEEITKLALVMDVRAHQFVRQFPSFYENLKKGRYRTDLVFLEASDEVLARRFSETRRKHPLSREKSAVEGVKKERSLLKDIRKLSTRIIDTSELNVHQLKDILYKAFGKSVSFKGMQVNITSFGYRYGLPMDADMILDVRFLPNPYFKDDLKHKTGQDQDVEKYIMKSGETSKFLKRLTSLLEFLIPQYEKEWKAYLNICVGCTGGKHRSVVIAKTINDFLSKLGKKTSLSHRDILNI
jgi:UPF0042 nucleotide-binding protein